VSPSRAKITEHSHGSILGLPCEIGHQHSHGFNFQLWLVDRLTKERTLIAQCDNPTTLAEWALEKRGASEVAHVYSIVDWEILRKCQ
jgi:hypothetical protein